VIFLMSVSMASLANLPGWLNARADIFFQRHFVPELSALVLKHPIPAFMLVIVAVFCFLVKFFPHRGTVVSFSEQTAKSSEAAAASRSLTAEVLHMLEDPEPLAVAGLQMNTWPGTDQPAFGVVRPAQALTPSPDFTSSALPIKLGGVEFSLSDVFRIVRAWFVRPHERTLVGWLSCGENSVVVEATMIRAWLYRLTSRQRCGPWRATAVGKDARERALGDIAAQILVDTQGNRYTDRWRSLRACQDGIRTMRRAESGFFDSNREARRDFTTALEHDSANWIARFYLALSLCGEEDGKPATALRHFQILDDVLSRVANDEAFKRRVSITLAGRRLRKRHMAVRLLLGLQIRIKAYVQSSRDSSRRPARLTALVDHLIRYPECPFILRYNIAIAVDELRRISGPQEPPPSGMDEALTDPLGSLQTIVDLRNPGTSLGDKYFLFGELLEPKQRLELSLYAQSARAHVMSMHDTAGSENELREIRKSVEKTCEDARCLDQNIESWRALETTKAVAYASLARALAAKEEFAADQEARQLLYQAIAAEPHLVDAYLQLAKLYIRRKDRFARDWSERAHSLLERADEMNPSCGSKAQLSKLSKVEVEDGNTSSKAHTA